MEITVGTVGVVEIWRWDGGKLVYFATVPAGVTVSLPSGWDYVYCVVAEIGKIKGAGK